MPDQFGNPLPGETPGMMAPAQSQVPALTIPLDPYATLPGQENITGNSPILDQISGQTPKQEKPAENNILDYFEYMKNNPSVSYDRVNADVYKAVVSYGMTLKMPTKDEMLKSYEAAFKTAGRDFGQDTKESLSMFWDEVNRNYQRYTEFEFSTNRSSSNIVPGSILNSQMGLNNGARSYDTTGQKLRTQGLEFQAMGEGDMDNKSSRSVAMSSNGNKGEQNGLYHKYAMDELVAENNYRRTGKVGILDPTTDELKTDSEGKVIYIPYEEGFLDDPYNALVPRTYRRDPNTGAPVLIPLDDEVLQSQGIDLRKVNNLMSSWSQPEFESSINPFSAIAHVSSGALGDMAKVAATTIDALSGSLTDNYGTSHANALSRTLYGAGTALQGSINADQKEGPLDNLASFGLSIGQVIQSFLPVIAASAGTGVLFRSAAAPFYGEAAAAELGAQIGAKAGLGYGASMAGESAYSEGLKSGLMTEREAAAFGAINAAAVYAVSNALQAKWLESLTRSMSPQARNKAFASVQKEIIKEMEARGVKFGNTSPAKIEAEFAKAPMQMLIKKFGELFGRLKEGTQKYWRSKDFSPGKQALLNNEGVEETLEAAIQEAAKSMYREWGLSNDFYRAARENLNTDFEGFLADNKRERRYINQLKEGRNYFSEKSFDDIFKEMWETFVVSHVGGGLSTGGTNFFRDFSNEKDKQLRKAVANSILDGITPSEFIAQGDQLRKQKRLGNSRIDYDTGQPTNEASRTENDLVYRTTVDMYKKYYGIAENLGLTSKSFLDKTLRSPQLRNRAQELLERAGNGDRMHYEALQKAIMPTHHQNEIDRIVFGLQDDASAKDIRSTLGVKEEDYAKAIGLKNDLEDAMKIALDADVDALLLASPLGESYAANKELALAKHALLKTPVDNLGNIQKRIALEARLKAAQQNATKTVQDPGTSSQISQLHDAQLRKLKALLAKNDILDGTVFKNAVMDSFLIKKQAELKEQIEAVEPILGDSGTQHLKNQLNRLETIFKGGNKQQFQMELDNNDAYNSIIEQDNSADRLGVNYDFDAYALEQGRKHHLIEGKRLERANKIAQAQVEDAKLRQAATQKTIEVPADLTKLSLKELTDLAAPDLGLTDQVITEQGFEDAVSIIKKNSTAAINRAVAELNRRKAIAESSMATAYANQAASGELEIDDILREDFIKANKNQPTLYYTPDELEMIIETDGTLLDYGQDENNRQQSLDNIYLEAQAKLALNYPKDRYQNNFVDESPISENELKNALFGAVYENGKVVPSPLQEAHDKLINDIFGQQTSLIGTPLHQLPEEIRTNIQNLDTAKHSPETLLTNLQNQQFYNDFSQELASEIRPILQAYGNNNHGLTLLPDSIYKKATEENKKMQSNLNQVIALTKLSASFRYENDNKRAEYLLKASAENIKNLVVPVLTDKIDPEALSEIEKLALDVKASVVSLDERFEKYGELSKYIRETLLPDSSGYTSINKNGELLTELPEALQDYIFSYGREDTGSPETTQELAKILGISFGDFTALFDKYIETHASSFVKKDSASLEQRMIIHELVATDLVMDSKVVKSQRSATSLFPSSNNTILLTAPAAAGKTVYIIRDYLNVMSMLNERPLNVYATSYSKAQADKITDNLSKIFEDSNPNLLVNKATNVQDPLPRNGHIDQLIADLKSSKPFPYDYVVYDETTLLPEDKLKELIRAVEGKTKLILAGDPYQIVHNNNYEMSSSISPYDQNNYLRYFASVTQPKQVFRYAYPSTVKFHQTLEKAIENAIEQKINPELEDAPNPFSENYLESYIKDDVYQGGMFTSFSRLKDLAKRLKQQGKDFVLLVDESAKAQFKDPELAPYVKNITEMQGSERGIVLGAFRGDHTDLSRLDLLRALRVASSRATDFFALATSSYTGLDITRPSESPLIPFSDSTSDADRTDRSQIKSEYMAYSNSAIPLMPKKKNSDTPEPKGTRTVTYSHDSDQQFNCS